MRTGVVEPRVGNANDDADATPQEWASPAAPLLSHYFFGGPGGAPPAGSLSAVGASDFAASFAVFTMGQLAGLDWANVCAAGGAVLACATLPPAAATLKSPPLAVARLLCRVPREVRVDPALSRDPRFLALHGRGAPGDLAAADIDLWLHGLSPARNATVNRAPRFSPLRPRAQAEAAAKAEHIFGVLRANAAARGSELFAARTKNTITFFSAYPFRMVQARARWRVPW